MRQSRRAASRIRAFLGISFAEQFGWRNADTAFKAWRSAFYRVGLTVFKDAFRADDFCGFSLYDSEFPVIFVNNSNTKTRQVFTLFHELAHLLHRTSGVVMTREFRHPLPADQSRIESNCNQLAASILVPEEEFNLAWSVGRSDRSEATRLARRFSVSREVIYRKFLDRERISKAEYEKAANEWAEQHSPSHERESGGNQLRTWLAYLGEEYVTLAYRRYHEERLDDEELADILGIKAKVY